MLRRVVDVARCLGPVSRRCASSERDAGVPLSLAAYGVWGATTGVGKTLLCAGLAAAQSRGGGASLYVKPLQTGFTADSDGELVAQAAAADGAQATHTLGEHAREAGGARAWTARPGRTPAAAARTLFAWRSPVGPHAAVQREGRGVSDEAVAEAVEAELRRFAGSLTAGAVTPLALVEAAGGVASPGPAGALQCDLLRSLRLPAVLVGDGALGGISTTLCALETLSLRGYEVAAVVVLDGELRNAEALRRHLPRTVRLHALPPPPQPGGAAAAGELPAHVAAWLLSAAPGLQALAQELRALHAARLAALQAAPAAALASLWWPFTQHDDVALADVGLVDGRHGDALLMHDPRAETLRPMVDACASWWTQGVDAATQPALVRAIGHAAGRYGHVMFPENAHAPALQLAERLLAGPGAGWASRVFYSDNGSTATEIALKMALRLHAQRSAPPPGAPPPRVLALAGSYHGDTLGAACAGAPSVFNAPLQAPWYSPRAVIVEPPGAAVSALGGWHVSLPAWLPPARLAPSQLHFHCRGALFDPARDASPLGVAYRAHLRGVLAHSAGEEGLGAIGAAIVEPVLHGASGMHFVDPQFQRALAQVCSSASVPLIADEVFSGLWRLGAPSACQLLGVQPDVACYAKLLTGGTVPLAATLASEAVFDAFRGAGRQQALLHGHSYSAHAVGCAAAVEAMDALADAARNGNRLGGEGPPRLRELWDPRGVQQLAALPAVSRLVCIGTVLAAELAAPAEGRRAHAARDVVRHLRAHGIFARPLGNVVYLMVTPMAPPETCARLLHALLQELCAEPEGAKEARERSVVC